MFTAQFAVFWMFLLCCCNKNDAKLILKNRTCVALAGKAVIHLLEVTVPVNSTMYIKCYQNSKEKWKHAVEGATSQGTQVVSANITMPSSSCSGEYYFEYMNEKVYWVVLVRDVGYLPDTDIFITLLLVVITVLLLLSIAGSVYIFKWYKNHPPSEGAGNEAKDKKRKRNTLAEEEEAVADSVYTALDQRTVSVYDVLNVDEQRRESTASQTSKTKAEPSTAEEGIFESVYENF